MTDWRASAACADLPFPDVMFPNDADKLGIWQAKSICMRCPVRRECGEWATANDVEDGVWGGLTGRQRDALKRAGAAV